MPAWVAPLISGLVALVVAGITALFNLTQLRRERRKWITEIKVTWSVELYKKRLESYPEALKTISALSHGSTEPVTHEVARKVAGGLNDWLYSTGGLCADATTRGAILGLRKACQNWSRTEQRPKDFYSWRNLAVAFLRRDLDLTGLELYNFDNETTMLKQLQAELKTAEEQDRKRGKSRSSD